MADEIPKNVILGTMILMPGYDPATHSGPEFDEFYAAMGRAMCAWSAVENALFEVYAEVARSQSSSLPNHIFWSGMYFKDQLQITHVTICNASLRPDSFEIWFKLRERINEIYKLRNAIAHGKPVITLAGDPPKRSIALSKNYWESMIEMRIVDVKPSNDAKLGHIAPRQSSPAKKAKMENIMRELQHGLDLKLAAEKFYGLLQQINQFKVSLSPPPAAPLAQPATPQQ